MLTVDKVKEFLAKRIDNHEQSVEMDDACESIAFLLSKLEQVEKERDEAKASRERLCAAVIDGRTKCDILDMHQNLEAKTAQKCAEIARGVYPASAHAAMTAIKQEFNL